MKRPQLLYVFLLIVICLLFLWPMFRSGFIATDDGDWMIIRLSAFYQSLREGQFPVRLLGRLNYSYGYPVANFLYPGFMYIGSVIHALGVPFVETVKFIFIGSITTATIFVFLWLSRFASPFVSFIGSITFILSPYVAFDIFRRGSIGEVLAIACIALSLYAIETGKKHITTLALAALILAHNSVAFLALPFILFYALYRTRWYIVLSLLLSLGLSAFFWIPALTERHLVQFNLVKVSNPLEYFSVNKQWFLLTMPHLAAFLISLLFWKRLQLFHRLLFIAFLIVTSITLPITAFFWNINAVAQLFQFPYRFLSIALFMGSLLFVLTANILKKMIVNIFALTTIALLLPSLLVTYGQIKRTNQPESFYTTNEATTTVAGEYLPRWVKEPPTERTTQEIEFYGGKGNIEIHQLTTQKVVASIKAEVDSVIQINSVYYPGWGVVVNGIPISINYDNPRGLIRFVLPKGEHSVISEFRETAPRFMINIISLMSLVLFLLAIIIPGSLKKRAVLLYRQLLKEHPEEHVRKIRT